MFRCSFSEKDCSRTKSKIVTEVLFFFVLHFHFITSHFFSVFCCLLFVAGGRDLKDCTRVRLWEFRGAGAGALRRNGIGVFDFRERMGRGRSNG